MESRSRANTEQYIALLDFMERHGDLSRPQHGPQGRLKAERLWQELVEVLNSMAGGVIKPLIKWKKVWTDWKTKTKKKSLAIRREASGTGGGPSSRQTLTALEERVLGIMGLSAVIGLAGIEERGFDTAPSEQNLLPPSTSDTVCPSPISATGQIMLEIPTYPIQATTASTAPPSIPPSIQSNVMSAPMPPSAPVQTPLPSCADAPAAIPSASPLQTLLPNTASAPMPTVLSPTASTSRGVSQRRWRRHRDSSSPAATPTTSTPRRHRLQQARVRRIQTPFERATSEFVAVEHRRLQIEADRDKKLHEREVERLRLEEKRLRLEEKRLEIEAKQNEIKEKEILILSRLGGAVDNLIEMLPQLIPSSLPSTDIIP
ncbi:hypothetical protein PYW08_000302 [Mythimna loreyi]|uniref:Uncharacterized protein n=1 Tax=Mythimna loreyi TaxID=667449 RepID=A0ACC2RC37_9NEOP|nr:hypothetical protein PYW08_000302 [Mythimna loreyi]